MIVDNLLIALGKDTFNEESKEILYKNLKECLGVKEIKVFHIMIMVLAK